MRPFRSSLAAAFAVAAVIAAALAFVVSTALPNATAAERQPSAPATASVPPGSAWHTVKATEGGSRLSFEGVVEAQRHSVSAAQVAGAVVDLRVKAGDRVSAGQVLLRLDARSAEQAAAASDAQVAAARAAREVAARDFTRQKQLFEQGFISQAALDRADAVFRSSQAALEAQGAQAGASRTQSGLHVVRAPFAGIVSEVAVALGDMALPGRPLVSVYDPSALRVTAAVPQSLASALPREQTPRIELASGSPEARWVQPLGVQWLPTLDAASHTIELRLDLPSGLGGLAPGLHARVWLQSSAAATPAWQAASVTVPQAAIVRRAELSGVYVRSASGEPVLRQVRLGRSDGQQVQVLAGLAAGEEVSTEPQAAARWRPAAAAR